MKEFCDCPIKVHLIQLYLIGGQDEPLKELICHLWVLQDRAIGPQVNPGVSKVPFRGATTRPTTLLAIQLGVNLDFDGPFFFSSSGGMGPSSWRLQIAYPSSQVRCRELYLGAASHQSPCPMPSRLSPLLFKQVFSYQSSST